MKTPHGKTEEDQNPLAAAASTGEISGLLRPAQLNLQALPPKPPAGKQLHARRPLPLVREDPPKANPTPKPK